MPDMKEINFDAHQAAMRLVLKRSEEELAEIAAAAAKDLGVLQRAAAEVELDSIRQAEKLWVAELAVEGRALECHRNHVVNLCLPDVASDHHPRTRYVKLVEFFEPGQYLATGRYRVIVQLIKLDDGS